MLLLAEATLLADEIALKYSLNLTLGAFSFAAFLAASASRLAFSSASLFFCSSSRCLRRFASCSILFFSAAALAAVVAFLEFLQPRRDKKKHTNKTSF